MRNLSLRAIGVGLAVAAFGLVSCGPPAYHYLQAPDVDARFRVPNEWTLFSEDEYKEAQTQNLIPPVVQRIAWASGFDASADPSLGHLFTPAEEPVGYSEVRELNFIQYNEMSIDGLRNLVLPLDEWLAEGTAEPLDGLRDQPFERGGLHGSRLTWAVELPDGPPVVYHQVALLDDDRSRVFLMAFSCSTDCYSSSQRTIDQIVTSLRVGED
jgi:hypothetical protein